MNINDYALLLLQAVVIAAVPIFAAAIKQGAGQFFNLLKERTEREKVREYLDQIKEVVETAVSCTSQTYVDSLKKGGEFNREEQKAALLKSLESARSSISPSVQSFILETYGDLDKYLTQLIEAEVRKQKIIAGTEQLTV